MSESIDKRSAATARRESSAAELLARGVPREEIAKRGGFHRKTLLRWSMKPHFQEQVERYGRSDRQALELRSISECQVRIAELDQRRLQLINEVEERATSAEMDFVPGGRTGRIKRGVLEIEGKRYFVYRLDIRMLKQFRELETQAATRLGQSRQHQEFLAWLPQGRSWKFDRRREQAAMWTAQGELSKQQIAAGCGVDRRTLEEWKRHTEFQRRIGEFHELWAKHCRCHAIARPETRVLEIRMRLQDLRQIQAERQAQPVKPYVRIHNGNICVMGFRRTIVRGRSRLVAEMTNDFELQTEIEAHEMHLRDEL